MAALVDAGRGRPFAWSIHDCATFAFDVTGALVGRDPAAAWRGRYRSLASGLRVMKRLGHADFAAIPAAQGWPVVPVPAAGRGDLALLGADGLPAFGVCLGARIVTVTESGGVHFVPLSAARLVWRV